MSIDQESEHERIERLIRKAKRINFFYYSLILGPGAVVLLSLAAAWFFGREPLWVQILNRGSEVAFGLSMLLMAIYGYRRPKFVAEFLFGPAPHISEEEKAMQAADDLVLKEFQRITRPISWISSLGFLSCLLISVQWYLGELDTRILLGAAIAALAAVVLLTLWAQHRVAAHYYNPE